MAKKPRSKGQDSWKLKRQYEVVAPEMFNRAPIGVLVAIEPEALFGRRVEATLGKLVNSNQHHIKIKFKISKVSGFYAETEIDSVELSRAYLNHQILKGTTIIDHIFDVVTSDGYKVRIKVVLFTKDKISAEQRKQLRKVAEEVGTSLSERNRKDQLFQEVIFGKVGSQIFKKGKRIVPLRRVEIKRIELVGAPEEE